MEPLYIGATLLRKYRVDRLCQDSGGVLLYEATDTVNARPVCVKIIRREALSDADTFARFQSAAHDPTVIDFGSAAGLPYYVATDWEGAQLPIPIYLDEDDEEDEDTLVIRRRSPWLWVAAILVVAGLTGAAGWYVGHVKARAQLQTCAAI